MREVIRRFRRAHFLDLRERYRIYRPAIMIVGIHFCKYNHLAAGDHPPLVPRPAIPGDDQIRARSLMKSESNFFLSGLGLNAFYTNQKKLSFDFLAETRQA